MNTQVLFKKFISMWKDEDPDYVHPMVRLWRWGKKIIKKLLRKPII